jgi:hypothetical protein
LSLVFFGGSLTRVIFQNTQKKKGMGHLSMSAYFCRR